MSSQQPSGPRPGESDAHVEQAMDDAPINPLTGTVEPEYVLVRNGAVADQIAEEAGRDAPPADDLDDAPINPETGMPEPTLTYVGEDDDPAR